MKSNLDLEFKNLYLRDLPRIYNYFRFRVGDEKIAEDLTSATFEKAWKNRHRYKSDLSAFSTWIHTIANRIAIDYYRRDQRSGVKISLGNLPSHQDPDDIIEKKDDLNKLSNLLKTLSSREREVVSMKYGLELTNKEIAKLTKLSESNIGVILHRSLKQLRKKWEGSDE
jgi:RNA polymerase sigma-70 factor (ECF subfamily)